MASSRAEERQSAPRATGKRPSITDDGSSAATITTTTTMTTEIGIAKKQKVEKKEEGELAVAPNGVLYRRKQHQRKHPLRQRDIVEDVEVFEFAGMRHVRPYDFTYRTGTKMRWFGRTLLDIFSSDFARYSAEYYREAIKAGRIRVNGEAVSPDFVLQNGHNITHAIHRHEPPVSAIPLRVVAETEDLLVVDKPPSMPCHPCGRYRHNSVTMILQHERRDQSPPPQFFLNHRLDRFTSGLLILTKSKAAASVFAEQLVSNQLSKTYLARVQGEFPNGKITCRAPIQCDNAVFGEHRIADAGEGKACETHFERLSFNGHSSVVQCSPITGRTHQIRVHLQHLGFPIANDPIYGGRLFADNSVCGRLQEAAEERKGLDIERHNNVAICDDCQSGSYWNDDTQYASHIWLHALRYKGPQWDFSTEFPDWAAADYDSRRICAVPLYFKRAAERSEGAKEYIPPAHKAKKTE